MVLRLYHVLLGCTLLALVPLGTKLTRFQTSSAKNSQPTPVAQPHVSKTLISTTSSTILNQPDGNIWKNSLGKTVAPPDWQVKPCEENALSLCVASKEKRLGTVEMGVYPLGQQLDFQKMLFTAGISLNSKVNYQNPKYQTLVAEALEAWIKRHYRGLFKNYPLNDDNDKSITFSASSPQKVLVGGLPGLRYEFVGRNQQGRVYEQHLGYVTFNGTALYVITTAFNSPLDIGKFETLEDFQRFEPHLSVIVANLNLKKL
jgi:hypothetical protein